MLRRGVSRERATRRGRGGGGWGGRGGRRALGGGGGVGGPRPTASSSARAILAPTCRPRAHRPSRNGRGGIRPTPRCCRKPRRWIFCMRDYLPHIPNNFFKFPPASPARVEASKEST